MRTKYSWKTTLCGIIGVFFVGVQRTPGIPDWLGHIFGLLAASAPSVGLLFARDNDRTSEEVGINPVLNGEIKNPPKPNS